VRRILTPPDDPDNPDGPRPLSELLTDPDTWKPRARLPTGLAALDEALDGGMVRGGLYVLAGLTSRGKSTLARALAANTAAHGHATLLVTLEDDQRAAVRKMVAARAGVMWRRLEQPDALPPEQAGEDTETTRAAARSAWSRSSRSRIRARVALPHN
jgi:replicative DNA helicase